MKKLSTPPLFTKQAVISYKLYLALIFMLAITQINKAQNTFPTNGNVGIGTLTPQFPLDVNGNARVTGNLLVGGGIITASVVNTTGPINAGDVNVTNNLNVAGSINASPTSTSSFGVLNASGNITTQGSYIFNTPVGAPTLRMRVYNGVNLVNTGPVIAVGDPGNQPNGPDPCSLPNNQPWFLVNGNLRSSAISLPNLNASLSMYAAPWSGDGHIESEGTNAQGSPNTKLYVNYFCGRDILLGTGTGPGTPSTGKGDCKIFTGDYVEMRKHLKIGTSLAPITEAANVALNVFANAGAGFVLNTNNSSLHAYRIDNGASTPFVVYGNGATHMGNNAQIGFANIAIQEPTVTLNINNQNNNGIKFHTTNASVNVLSINSDLPGTSPFTVKGNGKTHIGPELLSGEHTNALLQVAGKIACKSLFVLKPTNWADKVFSANYNLQDLNTVNEFIQKNKHLPGIKSEKEVLENGYDLNEMDAALLEKIESAYLYIIEQNREIEKMKEEIAQLKTKGQKKSN